MACGRAEARPVQLGKAVHQGQQHGQGLGGALQLEMQHNWVPANRSAQQQRQPAVAASSHRSAVHCLQPAESAARNGRWKLNSSPLCRADLLHDVPQRQRCRLHPLLCLIRSGRLPCLPLLPPVQQVAGILALHIVVQHICRTEGSGDALLLTGCYKAALRVMGVSPSIEVKSLAGVHLQDRASIKQVLGVQLARQKPRFINISSGSQQQQAGRQADRQVGREEWSKGKRQQHVRPVRPQQAAAGRRQKQQAGRV